MNQKKKGNKGERDVANLLKAVFPNCRRRTVGEEAQGTDLGRDLVGVEGWCVQCELSKRPNPMKKFNEAKGAAKTGERPVAFTRLSSPSKHGPWLVTLDANDFVWLLGQYERLITWLVKDAKKPGPLDEIQPEVNA